MVSEASGHCVIIRKEGERTRVAHLFTDTTLFSWHNYYIHTVFFFLVANYRWLREFTPFPQYPCPVFSSFSTTQHIMSQNLGWETKTVFVTHIISNTKLSVFGLFITPGDTARTCSYAPWWMNMFPLFSLIFYIWSHRKWDAVFSDSISCRFWSAYRFFLFLNPWCYLMHVLIIYAVLFGSLFWVTVVSFDSFKATDKLPSLPNCLCACALF